MSVLNVKLETKIPSECLSLDIFGVRTIQKFRQPETGSFFLPLEPPPFGLSILGFNQLVPIKARRHASARKKFSLLGISEEGNFEEEVISGAGYFYHFWLNL